MTRAVTVFSAPRCCLLQCSFLVNVSHLAIGRVTEVIPCDMNLVTENKEESTA